MENTDLHELLRRFVKLYQNEPKQREPEWYAAKKCSIGGSELAALLGYNPYSSFEDVVSNKVFPGGFTGNEACWWGTVFEPVVTRCVEIDCDTNIVGDQIWIRAPTIPHHANSPDGYCVFQFIKGDSGRLELLHGKAVDNERHIIERIAVLEFKCPFRRLPNGKIPRHYKPQVWDEQAVSSVAHMGMFIDAKFCRCRLADLGPEPTYDVDYHRRSNPMQDTRPLAWGLIGVYAQYLDVVAPAEQELAYDAWQMYFANAKVPPEQGRPMEPMDIGATKWRTFVTVLERMANGEYPSVVAKPAFADGRGGNGDMGAQIASLIDEAPAGHYLLGVLPWKLFDLYYVPMNRRPGFLAEISPLIEEAIGAVKSITAAVDPTAAMREFRERRQEAKIARRVSRDKPSPSTLSVEDEQDFFDVVAGLTI